MTPCIVKVLSDQWFLNYSNAEWKQKAKEAIAGMKIFRKPPPHGSSPSSTG